MSIRVIRTHGDRLHVERGAEELRFHSSAVIYQPSCQGFILKDTDIGLTPHHHKVHTVTDHTGAA